MERIGIIDLESSSIHLVIIDIKDNQAHHQIENLKETVRLGSGIDPQGNLSDQAVDHLAETISLFANFCKVRKVKHISAVATTAIRQAPNRKEIVDYIYKKTGIKIKVLTEEEEATLGYIGLVNTAAQTSGLLVDLGGGSLKLVDFKNRLLQHTLTLDFGSVSLMEKFNLKDLPQAEDIKALQAFLAESFAGIPWLQGQTNVVGVGGTLRSLARVYRGRIKYLPDITDGLEIPVEKVEEILASLAQMNLEQRRNVPGLEKARADLSVAGIVIIRELLKATASKQLTVATSSIRDGLFYKYLHPRDPIVFNVLTHHTKNLIDYHNLDENHLRRVSNLAVTLFDQLQALHRLNSYERRLLLIAGLLHELGVVISVESLEKHTLYTILNSPLHGLTHRERVLIAYLAASHEQLFLIGLKDYMGQGPITLEDIRRIKKLAPLLQIAHSLDRSRTGVVTQVRCKLTPEICEIKVSGPGKTDLEVRDANRRAEAFLKEYDTKLVVTQD
ncbi:MAG: Ppx/GppA family phosphatase [Firmicutes bacterium]|nr:Ppx/GppA family phosphatase [Bacillota bacterium]